MRNGISRSGPSGGSGGGSSGGTNLCNFVPRCCPGSESNFVYSSGVDEIGLDNITCVY